MHFYDAAFHINRLYARRHGYAFLYQVPKRDAAFDRHPSWMKLQMIREKLECCCQWALYMDSDSFLVMRNHALSIEGWMGQQETEALTLLLGNMYPYSEADLRPGFDPVAVISENTPYLAASYFCAGNLLFTRTKRSYEILDYWFNVTVQMDSSAAHDHPWEQLNLNKYVFPRFSSSFWVAPGEVWNSKHGEFIRHLWHPYGDEFRTNETVKHLEEVLLHEHHENNLDRVEGGE